MGLDENPKIFSKIVGFKLKGNVEIEFDALECLFSVKFEEKPLVSNGDDKKIMIEIEDKTFDMSQRVSSLLVNATCITFASH